jgi:hypothetical protein
VPLVDALRPPLKAGRGTDELLLPLEHGTARRLSVFQCLKGIEMPIDQDGIGQRPEVLGRLQFWGIGREKQQVEVVWHPQALGAACRSHDSSRQRPYGDLRVRQGVRVICPCEPAA